MTNLLEKALLTAFGIFLLITFLTLISPYWGQLFNIKEGLEDGHYSEVIFEIDKGINFVINNPNGTYQKDIYYPENLNITMNDYRIKFEYFIDNITSYTIKQYKKQFIPCEYKGLTAQNYILNVQSQLDFIELHLY